MGAGGILVGTREGGSGFPVRLFVIACALAVAGMLAFAGRASAVGELTYDACLNNNGDGGCVDLFGTPLNDAESVAVSPSGAVYVASYGSDSITHFFADPKGRLSYDGCLNDDGSSGCVDLAGTPLNGAASVAVSPNGGSVYVAAAETGTVTHFFAAAGGQISYDGCLNSDGSSGCGDLFGTPTQGAYSVAVSPSGGSVYVASALSNSVTHFFAAAGGQITYDGCLNNDGTSGCVDLFGTPLDGALSVAVSPDGGSVYVASTDSNSVTHFFAAAGGQITYDGCLNNDGTSGCVDLSGTPLSGAFYVAVSPDGKSVYVASSNAGSISVFTAAPGGQITYDGCFNNDGSSSCTDLPGDPLEGAFSVAVSPDGKSVYVASAVAHTISTFARAAGGKISYKGCLEENGSRGCDDLPGNPIDGAYGVAVSLDGRSVYVASNISNSVSHFSRKLAPPQTTIERATIKRHKRRATFRFDSSQEGSSFLCKLDRRAFNKCRSPKTYEHLGEGRHALQVKARNSQGTVDPTPATRSFGI